MVIANMWLHPAAHQIMRAFFSWQLFQIAANADRFVSSDLGYLQQACIIMEAMKNENLVGWVRVIISEQLKSKQECKLSSGHRHTYRQYKEPIISNKFTGRMRLCAGAVEINLIPKVKLRHGK